jgi:hypothetical protein
MTSGESPFTLFPWWWLVEEYNDVNRLFNVGIKAGTQPKQQYRLIISSRDALELVPLINGKMSDRQSVYARVRNM